MYLKEEDLDEILKTFRELCYNKYTIVFKDNSDASGRYEITLSDLVHGGVNELLKRTLLTSINSALANKENPTPKVVPLLSLAAPVESKEVVVKKSKMSVQGNHIMWDTLTKTRQ